MEQDSLLFADVDLEDFGGQNQIVNQQDQNTQVNPRSFNEVDNIEAANSDNTSDTDNQNKESNEDSLKSKSINPKKAGKLKERI